MIKNNILVVDDEEIIRDSLSEWLSDSGYGVMTVPDGASALEIIKRKNVDMMIADLKMPVMDGIELIKKAREIDPTLPVVIMTAYGTVASAIEAMKAGAYDYMEKPFCPERVEIIIKNLLAHQNVVKENIALKEGNIALKKELGRKFQFEELVGKSHKMQELFELIRTVAKSNATILIQGETGTGKELVAKAIHAESLRHKGPFVSLNCAALPESLLESELFGHEKGSFTGAIAQKKGKFELAHMGTIFLDEIGDISPNIQVHLLRVIQEREFSRVGGNELIKVDVRIITSTNRDLKKRIEEGKFREDLFYRFNVVPLQIPPLRERTEDIPLLARYFLRKYNTENNKNIRDFSPEAIDFFMKYLWPGNVRELENVIEHSVVVSQSDLIIIDNLPPLMKKVLTFLNDTAGQVQNAGIKSNDPDGIGAGLPALKLRQVNKSLKESEKLHILEVLEETDWNYTHAAKILGISRSTFRLGQMTYF
jgi:DNA-binding NtrC family response regulator